MKGIDCNFKHFKRISIIEHEKEKYIAFRGNKAKQFKRNGNQLRLKIKQLSVTFKEIWFDN